MLNQVDDFFGWVSEIRALSTKESRKLVDPLITLAQRMRHMGEPESSDDKNAPAPTAEPSSNIVADPPIPASRVGPAGITYIINDPLVCFPRPSNHFFLNQTSFPVQPLRTWQT